MMQNPSVQTGLTLYQAQAFCFMKDLLPWPFASSPSPSQALFLGQTGLLKTKINNKLLSCVALLS